MELMTEEKRGFKRTDVGLIPEDWDLKYLGEIAAFSQGVQVDLGQQLRMPKDGFVKFLRIENYTQNSEDFRYVPSRYGKDKFVNPNDVVIVRYGATAGYVGSGYEGVLANNLFKVTANTRKVSKDYLLKYLRSHYTFEFFQSAMFGGAMPALSFKIANKLPIPLPPTLEEQQAIASALSDVDELIRSLDGLIQKKQAIKKGTMQQLLSGKKRLPGFDGEWEVKKLGEVADIQRGASPRPISDSRWFSDNKKVGWVRISDISKSDGKYLHKTRDYLSDEGMKRSRYLDSGSLIMSIAATVGLPVITQMDLCIHDGFVGFWNLRDVDKEFLFYKLKFYEEEFINAGQTGSQNNINSDIVKNFESYIPSVEEQKAIAQILSDMGRELQTLRQKREKYVQIKQGMMQELLTGRVRLV